MTDLDPWTSPRPEHPDMALYRQHAEEWQARYPDTSQPARERHSGGGKWSTLVLLGDDWTPSYPRGFYADYVAGHRPKGNPAPRFWQKVDRTEGCWVWTGAVGSHGYGTFWDGTRFVLAHRYSLTLEGGLSNEGLHVDHLCRNRLCVRPDHLEPVTQLVNNRRALPFRTQATHCKRDHDFATHGFANSNGYRECRACIRQRSSERRKRARS